MTAANRRQKNPELVRHSLIANAGRLAAEKGLAGLSVQEVSKASGVTKGGFFHHFPNKQALIDAVFAEMMDQLEAEMQARLDDDPVAHGRFTRAYLRLVIETDASDSAWTAVWISMITDPSLRSIWHGWFDRQMERHAATENTPALHAVRMAADGIWLSQLAELPAARDSTLHDLLFDMTQP